MKDASTDPREVDAAGRLLKTQDAGWRDEWGSRRDHDVAEFGGGRAIAAAEADIIKRVVHGDIQRWIRLVGF